jgi:uncharacterized repeat protein (TIGR02543 family)
MSTVFPNGVIDDTYYALGDACPTTLSTTKWAFVDLRYTIDTVNTVSVNPITSSSFSGGVWTGSVTVSQTATAMLLRVDDGNSHTGDSNTFNVENLPPLTVCLPTSVTEGNGVLIGQGNVSVQVAPSTDLTINLSSSDTSEVTVPATVTILAGQTSVTFDITIVDDAIIDLTQTAEITASATGYSAGNAAIAVADNDTATLTVTLPANATEGDGVLTNQGSVTVGAVPTVNITVGLTSSNTSKVTVPATVTILAGQTSATFNLTIMNDTMIDGTQTVTISAHVAGWTDGTGTINILDNENTNLIVTIPTTAVEGNGTLTNAGTVSISGTLASALVVNISSNDTSEVTVPTTVTIPAGQTNVTFDITIIDDADLDPTQSATITASATGYSSGSAAIAIADNEMTVTYDTEGGAVSPMSKIVTFNTTYGLLPIPSRPGYAFAGWWSGSNGTGTQVTKDTIVTNATNHYIYAKWGFEVRTLWDLQKIGSGTDGWTLSAAYSLMNDIDASETASWSYGFLPIGTNGFPFTGIFEGNGHVVHGLTINRPLMSYVGLFGHISTTASIHNIGLVDGTVTGNFSVGGIVGKSDSGTVSDCYFTGTVSGEFYLGGLVGSNYSGTVTGCYTMSTVDGTSTGVGGLIGYNDSGTATGCYATGAVSGGGAVGGLIGYNSSSSVTGCYATGTVTAGGEVGGLIGENGSGSMLSDCYATGAVTATGNDYIYVGGLVGLSVFDTVTGCYATGTVTSTGSGSDILVGGLIGYVDNGGTENHGGKVNNCYATGAVTATGVSSSIFVGGLVGGVNTSGAVNNCYATGMVTGNSSYVGGLVGYKNSGVTVSGSYWDTATSGRATSAGGVGKTTADMKKQITFSGWNFTTLWGIVENGCYPYLRMDAGKLAADKAALTDLLIRGGNTDLAHVILALANPLPSSGSVNASTITWASDMPGVVSSDGQTVNRPNFASGDASVTLTATLTKEGVTDTKQFVLTVLKQSASTVASIASATYTVSNVGGGSETITGVPLATAKTSLLAGLTKGEANQIWNDSGIANPVMTGNTLVVTAEDGITTVTYTVTVNLPVITASSGEHGSITPSDSVPVAYDGNQTFTIAPAANYNVADVLVDGVSVGVRTDYTFNNVTTNHTIHATFVINQYAVNFDLGIHGTRTAGGALNQTIAHGSEAIAPIFDVEAGWAFTGWDMAFDNVTSALNVTAQYIPTYTVNFIAGDNGTITGTKTQTVNQGTNCTEVTAAPNPGYKFDGWSGDYSGTTNPLTITNVTANMSITANFIALPPAVISTKVFYNNSAWDADAGASANDDLAIAPDKAALLSGTATFANYMSYDKGLNGIMVDILNLPGTPTADDFTFKVGNDNAPADWSAAATPTISIRDIGSAVNRITLIWTDNAIKKTWLQVTVKATANTGLGTPYIFYFGNAPGDCGNKTGDAMVNAADQLKARSNSAASGEATITNTFDYNRDKTVDNTDIQAARDSHSSPLTKLNLIGIE